MNLIGQLLMVLFLGLFACTNTQPVKSDELILPKEGQLGIYYFRTSIRCETCDAIEQLMNEELTGKYAAKIENGDFVFRQYNLDEAEVADFALQFDVVFKSLIIIKNDKRVNLTNEAFLYALPKPEKFKTLFEETLDKL